MGSTLEIRYGRLLLTYPASYRRERGAEMLGTLMESARPGQRWPSLADAVDLLAGGIRHRAGLSAVPGLARGLALAGPIALACAGGLAGFYLIAEVSAAAVGMVRDIHRGWGPLPTLGPIVYAVWLLAALGRVALSRLASRWLIGAALAVTVLMVPLAHAIDRTRPTLTSLVPLTLFGLLGLAGTVHAPSRRERVGVAVGLVAAVGALIGLTLWHYWGVLWGGMPGDGTVGFVEPTVSQKLALSWSGNQALMTAGQAVLALLLGLLVAGARHRPLLWSVALLLVPGLPLVALLAPQIAAFQYSVWGLMPVGLAAGAIVLATAVGLARRDPVSGAATPARATTESALAVAGTLALGTAAAVAVVSWVTYRAELLDFDVPLERGWRQFTEAVWPLAAVASVLPVRWIARAAVTAALVVTVALKPVDDINSTFGTAVGVTQVMLIALGVVALVGLPASPPRRAARRLAGLVAAFVLAAALIWVPAWWQTGFLYNAEGVTLGAAAALTVAAFAGGRAVIAPMSPLWWRGAAMLLVSTAWIGVSGPTYPGAWATPLVLAGLLVAMAAIAARAALRARAVATPPDRPGGAPA
jgi:hypothetical protein